MKRYFSIYLLAMALCPLWAQQLPTVGDPSADDFIVRISQTGLRSEGAAISYDKQTLYLSMLKSPRTVYDLYVCRKENGRWQMPVRIDALSSDADDLDPAISSDENTIYFVRKEMKSTGAKKGEMVEEMNMYCAERLPGAAWGSPQQMVISNGKDSQLRLQPDDKTLCFTSIRDPKHPSEQRFMVKKLDKYNWTLPRQLPAGTQEDTLRLPILHLEGDVQVAGNDAPVVLDVYNAITQRRVASVQADMRGHYCLALHGGLRYMVDAHTEGYSHEYNWIDCQILERDSVVAWQPELTRQLQLRLCTYDLDNKLKLAPKLDVMDTQSGRRVSQMKKQANGDYLLSLMIGRAYRFNLTCGGHVDTTFILDTRRDVRFVDTELDAYMRAGKVRSHIRVEDATTGETIASQIVLHNLSMEDEPSQTISLEDGAWAGELRCATRYEISYSAVGYLFNDTTIYTPASEQELPLLLRMEPLRAAITVQLRNIQFEFNSYLLKEDSYVELRKVAELLRQNPSLTIELSAHTDDVGSDAYNLRLSQKRAESVANYLVKEEGIDARRLQGKGYGKSKPLVPNDSEENRAINRRVEFEIIDL